jgi:quinolinate synthase
VHAIVATLLCSDIIVNPDSKSCKELARNNQTKKVTHVEGVSYVHAVFKRAVEIYTSFISS